MTEFVPKLVYWTTGRERLYRNPKTGEKFLGAERVNALQVTGPADEQGNVRVLTNKGHYAIVSDGSVTLGRREVKGRRRVIFEKLLQIHLNILAKTREIYAASEALRRRRLA